jgi:putative SOS response-associated peptidase YedK
MCGRYTLYDTDDLDKRFGVKVKVKITPNYNVAPTQTMPVIRNINGNKELELMKWGIPRMVAKDTVKEIINTRSDKAFSRFWNKQVTQQRILIPANGFYEWKKTKDGKTPFLITLPNEEMYAFAGIWNSWKDKDGKEFNAYSIMTSEPNTEMKSVHDRMPVILHKKDEEKWLKNDLTDDEIQEMLWTPEDGYLKMVQVSQDVNSVRYNDKNLMTPLQTK